MSLQYTVTFVFLLFEICVYLLLVIPWPYRMRKALVHLFTSSEFGKKLYQVQGFLLLLVAILFAESLRMMFFNINKHEEHDELDKRHHDVGDEIQDQKMHSKIFYAERNVYLTSFTLFAAFAVFRLLALLHVLCITDEKVDKLEKSFKTQEANIPKDEKKNN